MSNKSIDIVQQELNALRVELDETVQSFQKLIMEQGHKIEDLKNSRERELDDLFKNLIAVIDIYDKADSRLYELFPEDQGVNRARTRFTTVKNRLLEILHQNGVQEIEFPDGIATFEDCKVEDTVPDVSKPNDTIVSIEKPGYRRNGRLIRFAEVIVVRN